MSSRTSASGLACAGSFVLDEHEIDRVGRVNHVADLAGREREGDVGKFLAEDGAFDPAPVAALVLLRALRIDGGHIGEVGAVLDFGVDFTGELDGVGVVRAKFCSARSCAV